MRFRLILPIALLAALLLVPASALAKSRYTVGMGDQNPQMFSDPNFKSLKIKKVRVIVPWNWRQADQDPAALNAYLTNARIDKKDVLVAFSALRGCYVNGKYSKKKACKAPSQKKFKASVKAFRKAYPQVKTFQPWNELNNKSQPTYKSPKLAASYYKTLKSACRKCTIVAADILDSSNAVSYVKRFQKYTKKQKPRLWGFHNYSDVNRYRTTNTTKFLKAVPGKVWLTETGGLVRFLPHFKKSTSRANKAVKYMFKLADRFSKKRKGLRSSVARLYPYTFYGYVQPPGQNVTPRFDAGLVGPLLFNANYSLDPASAKPRAAFKTFKKLAKSRSK
jgi:Glycosyl hydrolase catalytic core